MDRTRIHDLQKESLRRRNIVKSNCSTDDNQISTVLSEIDIYPENSIGNRKNSVGGHYGWKLPIEKFSSKKLDDDSLSKIKSKRLRSYYEAQNDLITSFELIQTGLQDKEENSGLQKKQLERSSMLAKITFIANLVLMIAKIIAVVLSGSISVVSSLVDSIMDLTSGIVIWWSTRSMNERNPYKYPQGKTRLEPIAIVILSVIMALASVLLIQTSFNQIHLFIQDPNATVPDCNNVTIIITVSTVVVKVVLFLVCRQVQTPSCQALANDHKNDALSNIVVIVCGYIGSYQMRERTGIFGLVYVDPIGAILIGLYIAFSWWKTGGEQITLLAGYTASPEFISKITWLALNHSKYIKYLDTVRAYHVGTNFLVEIHIILSEDMSLKQAHDIGESLQNKVENFPEVERAFVHVDYEFEHDPKTEHKEV